MSDFSLNSRAGISVRSLGHEGQPLVIIDQALNTPAPMRALARQTPFIVQPHTLYPGRNAPAPTVYTQQLQRVLRPLLDQIFGIPTDVPLQASSFLALATASPAELRPEQKIPHHDSHDPFMIAMVHYLCESAPDAPQGGTAFFRHAASGYEYVDGARSAAYLAHVQTELAQTDLSQHAGPATPHYKMIDQVDCVCNRLILYRSTSLHSGRLDISTLRDDPQTGRLTLNTLIQPRR